MDKIGEIKETSNVRIIPVSADSAQENCEEANCPDDEFLSMIKDDSLDNWLDGSKCKYIEKVFIRKKTGAKNVEYFYSKIVRRF